MVQWTTSWWEVNGGHDWVSGWLGDMEFFSGNTHVSPKWRIQSSLEAKPKQFHLWAASQDKQWCENEEEQGQVPQKAWEASDPNQVEPNNQASSPRDGGAAQALEKKSGQTASTTGGRASSHSHIILTSSSQPAGWIHLILWAAAPYCTPTERELGPWETKAHGAWEEQRRSRSEDNPREWWMALSHRNTNTVYSLFTSTHLRGGC